MRGYLWIEKRPALTEMALGPEGVRGLAVSLSVGVLAGCLAAYLRFHLGLPGHKALLWMTPVIAARLFGRCRVGTTAGALIAAFVSLGMGGNLAGGLPGLPLVGLAGALIDATVVQLEKRKTSVLTTIAAVAFSAMLANLICCAKRLFVPAGVTPHDIFGAVSLLARPLSYGLFGFLAGLIAAASAQLPRRRKKPGR
ncbi:MAG: hypothetical protein JSW66_05335 [Phycisphaerales bacterium]|nr:MAG: hypothetical protein JSW66_05335 [Phycisphaerales bacterium]